VQAAYRVIAVVSAAAYVAVVEAQLKKLTEGHVECLRVR
jgi:hypothetical protein